MAQYYQLAKAGRVARRTGILSLIFASTEFIVLILLSPASRSYSDLVLFSVVQILPGVIVLSSADAVENGNPAAFFVVFATSILAPLRWAITALFTTDSAFGFGEFACDIYTSLPLLFLLVTCKDSLGEIRQLIRRRREDRLAEQRGFPVVIDGQPLTQRPVRVIPLTTPVPAQSHSKNQTQPVTTPYRASNAFASHYMHLASRLANIVGVLSVIRAVILVTANYLMSVHDNGPSGLDAHMQNVLIFYVSPAVLLILLAWRMERNELWAYLVCTAAAGLLVIRIFISLSVFKVARIQAAHYTAGADMALQLPSGFLLLRCIYAMPDVWDIRRQRYRERSIDRARAEGKMIPAPVLASVVPPPPSRARRSAPSKPQDFGV